MPTTRATIYVTPQAMATVEALEGLDHYQRAAMAESPETDLSHKEGYYLNVNSLCLKALPEGAEVAFRLTPQDADFYRRHVTFPPELRGVVFSGAPNLPDNYAEIITYWSALDVTDLHQGAQYAQNTQNEYFVNFNVIDGAGLPIPEADFASQDVLLTNGLVLCIRAMARLVAGFRPDQFVEVGIPVNPTMLGAEPEGFDSGDEYDIDPNQQCERIFLKVQDILDSPDPDAVFIAAIHTELWDYGFCY